MSITNPNTGFQPSHNLINTNDNYKRCEEIYLGPSRFLGRNSFSKMLFRGNTSGVAYIVIPVCLIICFLITMLGVMFLFTSVFLVSKMYVMNVFMSEMNSLVVTLVFVFTSIHLLATGGIGIAGLTNRSWLLPVHLILGTSVLTSAIVINHFEGEYESSAIQATESRLLASLANNGVAHKSGWDFLQSHLQCCGIHDYTDWCTYSNENRRSVRNKIKLRRRFARVNITNANETTNTSDDRLEPKEKMKKSLELLSLTIVQPPLVTIRCYFPDSCCAVKLSITSIVAFTTSKNEQCSFLNEHDMNYNGCKLRIVDVMMRFVNSFKSLIKFIVVLMMIELPLATYMAFHRPLVSSCE